MDVETITQWHFFTLPAKAIFLSNSSGQHLDLHWHSQQWPFFDTGWCSASLCSLTQRLFCFAKLISCCSTGGIRQCCKRQGHQRSATGVAGVSHDSTQSLTRDPESCQRQFFVNFSQYSRTNLSQEALPLQSFNYFHICWVGVKCVQEWFTGRKAEEREQQCRKQHRSSPAHHVTSSYKSW